MPFIVLDRLKDIFQHLQTTSKLYVYDAVTQAPQGMQYIFVSGNQAFLGDKGQLLLECQLSRLDSIPHSCSASYQDWWNLRFFSSVCLCVPLMVTCTPCTRYQNALASSVHWLYLLPWWPWVPLFLQRYKGGRMTSQPSVSFHCFLLWQIPSCTVHSPPVTYLISFF